MSLVRFATSVQLVIFARLAWLACLACLGCMMFVSACGYDDRSYDGIVFACTAAQPCADGVACVNGLCAGSGSGSNAAKLGVACGTQQCAPGMSCCDEPLNAFRCAAPGTCGAGSQEVQCDGKEDCAGGRSCCFTAPGTACEIGDCGASPRICSTPADCPGDEPFCCDFPFSDVRLKHCFPVSCP